MSETSKPISRQWAQQLKLRAEHKCPVCWKQLMYETTLCDPCREKKNAYARKINGHKKWKPGTIGRPPKKFIAQTREYLSPIELKMRTANWFLPIAEIIDRFKVSESTAYKYRKIYRPTDRVINDVSVIMSQADYSLTNKELMYLCKVSGPTVVKYRKIYAPKSNS
jgi:DNA-binding CsgD family transcriptional regulator